MADPDFETLAPGEWRIVARLEHPGETLEFAASRVAVIAARMKGNPQPIYQMKGVPLDERQWRHERIMEIPARFVKSLRVERGKGLPFDPDGSQLQLLRVFT